MKHIAMLFAFTCLTLVPAYGDPSPGSIEAYYRAMDKIYGEGYTDGLAGRDRVALYVMSIKDAHLYYLKGNLAGFKERLRLKGIERIRPDDSYRSNAYYSYKAEDGVKRSYGEQRFSDGSRSSWYSVESPNSRSVQQDFSQPRGWRK